MRFFQVLACGTSVVTLLRQRDEREGQREEQNATKIFIKKKQVLTQHIHDTRHTTHAQQIFIYDYDDYDEASGEKTVLLDFVVSEKRFFLFFSELLLE